MKLDWTHKGRKITDIRKIQNFYIISIDDKNIETPLMVSEKIFNERLRVYYLKESHRVTREEILNVFWNFYITKGHYIKIQSENEEVKKYDMDENKFYVSYLEISGNLATFSSVYKIPKEQ